ncbi:plasmid mobilization protein [Sphingobacterium sp. NPDC055346]
MITNKNLRPHRVAFRLSDIEFEKLRKEFKEFGYNKMSDFARFKLLLEVSSSENFLVSKDLKTELKEFNYQINKVGNNINQITKAVHSQGISNDLALDELNMMMKLLYKFAIDLNRFIYNDDD